MNVDIIIPCFNEDKNIKTLDINHKLYDYFEKDEIREKMIHMFISRPELLNQLRG